jgi:hypothetical protein
MRCLPNYSVPPREDEAEDDPRHQKTCASRRLRSSTRWLSFLLNATSREWLPREIQENRLPAGSTVLVQNCRVYEQRIPRRLNTVRAVNVSEAMELRLDPDHRASQGGAALSTIEDALRWTVGNEDVRVIGNGPPQCLALCLIAYPKSSPLQRRDWTRPQLDPLDRDRLIEEQRCIGQMLPPLVAISLDRIFMVAAGEDPIASRLLREPLEEPVHGLFTFAEKAPVSGVNEKVTGRNFGLAFELVRVRYNAESHPYPIFSPQ